MKDPSDLVNAFIDGAIWWNKINSLPAITEIEHNEIVDKARRAMGYYRWISEQEKLARWKPKDFRQGPRNEKEVKND